MVYITLIGIFAGIFIGYLGRVLISRGVEKGYEECLSAYKKSNQAYLDVLTLIRRDRMLFTKHPKFRETTNLISRLLS